MKKKKNHEEEEEEEKNNNSRTEKKLHTLSHFEDVILEKECAARIMELAQASRNAQKNRAPYRHLLFYGPAGTGKSMVAKRLALHSGMVKYKNFKKRKENVQSRIWKSKTCSFQFL